MLIRAIILFTFIGLLNPSTAQDIEISPIQFNFRQNPSQIVGMTQDDQGHIWLCDVNFGLFKYDGTNLEHFTPQAGNPNSLSSNRTECIATDGQEIWVGTFYNGLNRYNPKTRTFTHYYHDPNNTNSIRSDHIRTLAFDHDGMLWIGTLTGVDKLDPRTGIFTHVHTNSPDEEILASEHIRAMYIDRGGILWVGSSSPFPNEETMGGLFRIDSKQKELTHYLSSEDENSLIDNRVRAIFEDRQGKIWIGTAGDGLHILDPKTSKITRHRYDPTNPEKLSRPPLNTNTFDHITFINEDNNGHIWIGTFAGGLGRFNPQSQLTQYYSTESTGNLQLTNNSFWTSLKSHDGLLWLAQWTPLNIDEVLIHINAKPNKIEHFEINQINRTAAFAEDDEGNLFIGSVNGLWKEKQDRSVENVFLLEGLQNTSDPGVRDIEFDEDGNIWTSTIRGLLKYSLETKSLSTFTDDMPSGNNLSHNDIHRIEYIGNNQLLVGSQRGLDVLNTRNNSINKINFNTDDTSQISLTVMQVLKDSEGFCWIATGYNGLKRIELSTGKFKNYSLGGKEGLYAGVYVYYIFEDSQKNLWICTEASGLYRYDRTSDSFTQILDNGGFLTTQSNLFSITEDLENNLWMAIMGGILKLNPKTLDSRYFGLSWGVSTMDHTERAFTSSNGEIFFGTTSGYYRFHPGDLQYYELATPRPFISQFNIDDQEAQTENDELLLTQISESKKIDLKHDQNNFSFRINHIDYITASGDRRLQCKLDNYDSKWRDSRTGAEVSYYNVPPGNYKFHIKASDINGAWGETTLDINITPPWWQTKWAYIGYLVLLLSGGWLVHTFQKERTVRKERERIKDKELAHAKEIEKAYSELKITQAQLIQSEKMASLGELTAGIAHEIKNPLNFVNNFSEVNKEMAEELLEEIEKGDYNEVKSLAGSIISNQEKITHHGKRADSIVKNMLQHSRAGSGEKQATDINALADEYLRLAYHGLRAKDSNFNCKMETDLEDRIGKVNVIPQDFGRVLLNLITNAFQAVNEKQKLKLENYDPIVKIASKVLPQSPDRQAHGDASKVGNGPDEKGSFEIRIQDNGTGIPDDIKDKIFQPFFTTKPTGEGTGLGLSMSYDIVTKGHGGTLEVKSEEGEGTEFVVRLPIETSEA